MAERIDKKVGNPVQGASMAVDPGQVEVTVIDGSSCDGIAPGVMRRAAEAAQARRAASIRVAMVGSVATRVIEPFESE